MNVSSITPSPNSTRPYLIRALYEWCTDNGYTPYIAAYVDATVQVPMEYVKNNEIVLNVSMDATSSLKLGNEFVEFKARFGGKAREIMVPIERVIAIYARENGQGMAFPVAQAVLPRGEVTEPTVAPSSAQVHSPAETSHLHSVSDSHTGEPSHHQSPKLVQLVTSAPDTSTDNADGRGAQQEGGTDDDAPKPPSGPRPALKRVK